jgi:protoheme IX farnesyltransferase
MPQFDTSRQSRHTWLWVALPLVLLAYLWTVTPFAAHHLFTLQPLMEWQPLLMLCVGMSLLLLARAWVVRLSGQLARSPLMRMNIGLSAGMVMIATCLLLMQRPGRVDLFEMAEWIFVEANAFLLILAWFKVCSLPIAAGVAPHPTWRDYIQLTKMGLNGLVLFTTFVGFFMASPEPLNWWYALRALLGTGFVAWGASTLNQFMERDVDALMRRTASRPLPAGRMSSRQAVGFGVLLCLVGLGLLAFTINILTAAIAAMTLAVYLFLYTPLKRINSLSTLAGAISGALPPVLGWTATGRGFQTPALVLFAILFLWQIPHFLAIAWKYREQYARAGFPMYSVTDAGGRATALQSLLYTLALVPISLLTGAFGLSGPLYLIGGGALGVAYLACALYFLLRPTVPAATRLFFASIAYLPFLFGFMLLDNSLLSRFGW